MLLNYKLEVTVRDLDIKEVQFAGCKYHAMALDLCGDWRIISPKAAYLSANTGLHHRENKHGTRVHEKAKPVNV